METIYDHHVTDEEVIELCGYKCERQAFVDKFSQNVHFSLIYRLYGLRNDPATAKKYFDKIPDTMGKYFSLVNHCRNLDIG